MAQTIFITGASSGIGPSSAKLFFDKGWNVVATMRSPSKDTVLITLDPARMLIHPLDLQDPSSIQPAMNAAITKFQKIDLLLNNAGYGGSGVFEAVPREVIQAQFDVNLFGNYHCRSDGRDTCPPTPSPGNQQRRDNQRQLRFGVLRLPHDLHLHRHQIRAGGLHGIELAPQNNLRRTNFSFGRALPPPRSYKPFVEKTKKAFAETFAGMNLTAKDIAEAVWEAATDGRDRLRYLVIGNDVRGCVEARYDSSGSDEEYVATMRSFFP
ncbi:short-chain alcohol dehydrogenase [Lyophyllum atratum]|nr:short-chain alcohol dehydrogenase [Lyophyllum atratum]